MGKYTKVEEKLIEEIEKYPALWNTKDINYKNKNIKENAWQIVTDAVNAACQSMYSGNINAYVVLCCNKRSVF